MKYVFVIYLLVALDTVFTVDTSTIQGRCDSNTFQLNVTHIERTWQPKGHVCPWMSSESELSTSGPYWFVIELKQSYYIDQINLLNTDGEWQTPGAVGSHVSALVAANLPLELQLEDPCSAGWDNFSSSERWRRMGDGIAIPVLFILFNSTNALNFKSIRTIGRKTPISINVFDKSNQSISAGFDADKDVYLNVTSCTEGTINCYIKNRSGIIFPLQLQKDTKYKIIKLKAMPQDHGSYLLCNLNNSPALDRIITIKSPPENSILRVPSILVAGRSVNISFTSDSFPESFHSCVLNKSNSVVQNLTLLFQSRFVISKRNNKIIVRLKSWFGLNVSAAIINDKIFCYNIGNVNFAAENSVHYIGNISEPCVTSVGLGSSTYWIEGQQRLIQISSHNCTIGRVNHTCWLTKTSKPIRTEPLIKINETQFTSIHQVEVSRWMTQSDWSARCRVNQSGIEYEDVESTREQRPLIFYQALLNGTSPTLDDSHLTFIISNTDSNPPVSNVTCNINDLAIFGKKLSNVNKNNALQSWEISQLFNCNQSTRCNLSINCVANQIFNGSVIFRPTLVKYFNVSNNVSNQGGNKYKKVPNYVCVIIFLSVALLTAIAALILQLTAKRSLVNRMKGFQKTDQIPESDEQIRNESASGFLNRHQVFPAPELTLTFVTVIETFSTSASCLTDDSYLFDDAMGHYEPDGCTIVQYI